MLRFCRLRTHALYIGTTHFVQCTQSRCWFIESGISYQKYLQQSFSVDISLNPCVYCSTCKIVTREAALFYQYSVNIHQLSQEKLHTVFKLFSFTWWKLQHKTKHILLTSYYLSSRYCARLLRIQTLSYYPSHQ